MKRKIEILKPFLDTVGKSEVELDFNGIALGNLPNVPANRYPRMKKELPIKYVLSLFHVS